MIGRATLEEYQTHYLVHGGWVFFQRHCAAGAMAGDDQGTEQNARGVSILHIAKQERTVIGVDDDDSTTAYFERQKKTTSLSRYCSLMASEIVHSFTAYNHLQNLMGFKKQNNN